MAAPNATLTACHAVEERRLDGPEEGPREALNSSKSPGPKGGAGCQQLVDAGGAFAAALTDFCWVEPDHRGQDVVVGVRDDAPDGLPNGKNPTRTDLDHRCL